MRKRTLLLILLCAPFARADDAAWQWTLRTACLADAEQSTAAMETGRWIRTGSGRMIDLGPVPEQNSLYRGLSDWERGPAVLAVGYGVERLITGIHDAKCRQAVGWLAAGFEAFVVLRNETRGWPIFGFKF